MYFTMKGDALIHFPENLEDKSSWMDLWNVQYCCSWHISPTIKSERGISWTKNMRRQLTFIKLVMKFGWVCELKHPLFIKMFGFEILPVTVYKCSLWLLCGACFVSSLYLPYWTVFQPNGKIFWKLEFNLKYYFVP